MCYHLKLNGRLEMPNRFTPIAPGTDPAQQLAIINKNFAELDNETVKMLYDDDTGTHRIFIDATSGRIKASKSGVDVTTATADQLTFDSGQDVFKIVKKVSLTLTITLTGTGSKTASVTQAHGFAFLPAYAAFITIDAAIAALSPISNTNGPNPFLVYGTSSPTLQPFGLFQVGVDATNITFSGQLAMAGSSTLTNSATVYLLQETAN